jgi:hypothetical protein
MGTYKAKCDICYTENEVPNYGDWTCSECHQPYEYDEGHRIHLTEAQLKWLRQRPITDAEQRAIKAGIEACEDIPYGSATDQEAADTLKALLARLT